MIRKNYLLIACAMLLTLTMAGQTTYLNSYEAPTTGNHGVVTLSLPDGSLLTGGNVSDFNNGNKEIMLVKTDTAGFLHWTKTIGTTDENYFVGMKLAAGGQVAILSYDSIAGQRYHKMMLVDTAGSINFEKTFLISSGPQLTHQKILSLTSGNIIIYGTSGSHVVLINMNTLGTIIWTRDLSSVIAGVTLTDVDLTEMSNGDLAFTVNMEGGSLLTKQFSLLLLNSTANVLSSQSFSTTVNLSASRVYYSPSTGDLIIAAAAEDGKILLLRLDSGGLPYWTNSYATTRLNDGGVIDMAYMPASDEWVTLSSDHDFGFEINRFSANGDFLWSMSGPYGTEMPSTISTEISGGFIVTGNILSTTSGFYNMFTARIMSDGLLCDHSVNLNPSPSIYSANPTNEAFLVNPSITLTDTAITDTTRLYLLVPTERCQEYVGITDPESAFTLHSNIVSSELQLRTLEPYNKKDQLIITDLSGRIVDIQVPAVGNYELTLNVSLLREGYYILSLYKNGSLSKERFLIMR